MSNHELTPGKLYRTRDGKKARIYATDGGGAYAAHGAILTRDGWEFSVWTKTGVFITGQERALDIVAEWKDAPIVDWAKMPAQANFVARDGNGKWFAYVSRPGLRINMWNSEADFWSVYPEHSPEFAGHWQESLVERPKTEGDW